LELGGVDFAGSVLAGLVELGDAESLDDFGGPFKDLSSAAFLYESLR